MPRDPAGLRAALDALYLQFDARGAEIADPVQQVRRYADPADREIAAFCAAGLAFGQVPGVLRSTGALLAAMGPSPARFVRRFDLARDGGALDGITHRWVRGRDLAALVLVLQRMLVRHGSIERFFRAGDPAAAGAGPAVAVRAAAGAAAAVGDPAAGVGDPAAVVGDPVAAAAAGAPAAGAAAVEDVAAAMESFSERALASLDRGAVSGSAGPGGAARPGQVGYFFPRPSKGSACKRLNLFLRWMVRRDRLDAGVWTTVAPSRLIVPLDVHVVRVGQCLRLTRYRSPGLAMARDITASLRRLDPADPVKYDFALCHLGMLDRCGFRAPRADADCPLRGWCRPRPPRRRRRSGRPSGRR